MQDVCASPQLYKTQLNRQGESIATSLLYICIFLPLQFIFLMIVLIKGYKKLRKLLVQKQKYTLQQQIQKQNNQNPQIPKKQDNDLFSIEQQKNFFIRFIFYESSRIRIIVFSVLFFLLVIVSLIMLILSGLAIFQAVRHNYADAQCQLGQSMSRFREGTQEWIGLQNLIPNITQLNLMLNTRIQVSINAIKGLVLNGTVALIKPGLGFANNSAIPIIYQQFPLNRTNLTYNTIKSNIDANVRYWLFMNTSLSGTITFPVCQRSVKYPIQHPFVSNQTIELNYMDDICKKITSQVDDLVSNGGKVDELLVKLEDTKNLKPSIESNLSALASIYYPIALRSKQYYLDLSSFNSDYSYSTYIPIVVFCAYLFVSLSMIIYLTVLFSLSCCDCCECQCKCQDQQQNIEDSDQESSIDIVWAGKAKKKQIMKRKAHSYREISSAWPKILLFLLICVNVLVGIGAIFYVKSGIEAKDNCIKFKNAQNNTDYFNSIALKSTQKELLLPIHQCTSSSNLTQSFMQSFALLNSRPSLQRLFDLSGTYNASVPKNIYNSQSLAQIQVLKQYLFHLDTMPIKSSSFNLIELLTQVNNLSNGSADNSKQFLECGKAVINDEYRYNAVDCRNKVMDLINQLNITQPRCIIIPTYDGTPGTVTTRLNEAQHLFTLNPTCPSINNMFSPGNTSCFLAKRLSLLKAQNCTKTAAELGSRLQNLVKFSQQASSFTDIYIQNLRNVFGIYATSSTNLTQFFAGTNMSQTLNGFGILTHNLLNRTKCDFIKNQVNKVYDKYCPTTQSMTILFNEGYVWAIVAVVGIFSQSVIFYWTDVAVRVYRINRVFGKFQRRVLPIDQRNQSNNAVNKIQISQQTLIRNNEQNIFQNQLEQQYRNELHSDHDKFPNQNKNINIQDQQEPPIIQQPCLQTPHKNQANDTTKVLMNSPSPMKTNLSKNPYGNFSHSDSLVQYPHLSTEKKLIVQKQEIGLLHKDLEAKEAIYQTGQNQKSDRNSQDQHREIIQLNGNLEGKDGSQTYDLRNSELLPNDQTPSFENKRIDLHQNKTNPVRRMKKVNIQLNAKPQLFFNLDQSQKDQTKNVNKRFESHDIQQKGIGQIQQLPNNDLLRYKHQKLNTSKLSNAKTQNIIKQKNKEQIMKNKNYLQIHLNDFDDNDEDSLEKQPTHNELDSKAQSLQKKKKNKKSKEKSPRKKKIRQKDQQRQYKSPNKTAR